MKRLIPFFALASLTGCNTWSSKTDTTADSITLRGVVGTAQAAVIIKIPARARTLYHPGDTLRCTPATYDPHHLGNLFIPDSSGNYAVAIQSLTPVLH